MKKKIGLTFLILFLLCAAACTGWMLGSSKVYGSTATVDGLTWYYNVNNGNAVDVYLYSGTPGTTLTIPSTLGGYTVTGIRGSGTSTSTSSSYRYNILRSNASNTTITKVIIPDTVTSIGVNTFANFDAVKSFDIPASVTAINSYAFYDCVALESVNFAEGNVLATIGTYAFQNNRALTEVNYNGNTSLVSIGNYAFQYCSKLKAINLPNSVTTIGNRAYYSCSGATELTLPSELTTIDTYAFYGVSNVKSQLTLPTKLKTIGNNAFYSCSGFTGSLEIPASVETIGSSAFCRCTGLTGLKLNEGLKTINSSAFQYCSGMKGDLIIPDSVTSLGNYAFQYCSGFDGNLYVGKGVKSLPYYIFADSGNFNKATVSSGITTIGSGAFQGFSDIWIENTKENVSLNTTFSGNSITTVHWLGETHRMDISVPNGVKIINTDTSLELTSGDYECDCSFKFKVEVDSSKNYSDLKLIIVRKNDFDNAQVIKLDTTKNYEFNRLTTDAMIIVQSIKQGSDLSLRTFITEVNREKVSDSREPIFSSVDGDIAYKHTKFPVSVKKSDLITYKIRVYNEGTVPSTANKISMYIPEQLDLVEGNKTNTTFGWTKEDNKITTAYLSNKSIKAYTGKGTTPYEDIEVVLQVKSDAEKDEDLRLVTITEIEQISNSTDNDSTAGSITSNVENSYKEEESYASNGSSYIRGTEDDDDFENILLKGKIKVDYIIRINKIDAETNELLSGAKFNLLNENGEILKTSITSDEGFLDFGMVTSYGEGQDIYYIEEAGSPEGYIIVEKSKIKVVVTKTILDEAQGTYSVNVVCEVLDYNMDTTRYEFTPIYTLEQLQKIGSGETVTIDGVNYKYNVDANYKLMADIDASSIQWKPIEHEIKGIINGNGHKISNLTFVTTEGTNIAEVGLFRVFSGIIENLDLENVNINMTHIFEDAESISSYSGVGGFAGVMVEGTIRNCNVSGNIVAATDNIGGFVGHTAEGHIVKIQNCVNNASIVGKESTYETEVVNETTGVTTTKTITAKSSNIGGIAGCALGALSVADSTNNGTITSNEYNVGGIVGYVKASNYQEVTVTADFDESEKVITLVIENVRTSGKYELQLETRDAKTLGLIEGASYTILDKDRKPIDGCENVQLVDGKLKVATININTLGVDTYYIKENSTVPGYNELSGNIKLEVRRYWDDESGAFKVSVETGNLSDNEYEQDEPTKSEDSISSQTGEIFTKVNIDNEAMFANKAEFIGCKNNGKIISTYMNAAGIAGAVHCYVRAEECENTGEISATNYGKAAGIISELNAWNANKAVEILNCENSGDILSNGSTGSAAGIVAHSFAELKVIKCSNSGNITAGNYSAAAGILADANGFITLDFCTNTGHITAQSSSTYSDVNCIAAGIIAKNIGTYGNTINGIKVNREDNNLVITNCTNTGNIDSTCHTGGILAETVSKKVVISDCNVLDSYIHDTYAGDKGGIVGFASTEEIYISNCVVDNVDLNRTSTIVGNTYGDTAGIIGNYCVYGGNGSSNLELLKVTNCTVNKCNIKTKGKETGGILGGSYGAESITDIIVTDCKVENCEIINEDDVNTYGGSAGIIGATYSVGTFLIDNNIVKNNIITVGTTEKNMGSDYNAAGVLAIAYNSGKITISNNDVIDCTIINNGNISDGCANAAGIVGLMAVNLYSYGDKFGEIVNCNVINTDISTISGNLGGILGVGYQSGEEVLYRISNCKVEGTSTDKAILRSTSQDGSNSITAGIAAFIFTSCEIDNCSVNNLEIYGNGSNTAGILGEGYHHVKMANCKTENTKIESTGHYGNNACVSGIAGTVPQKVDFDNCDVKNCEIIGYKAGNVTGVLGVGFGSDTKIIKNSDIIDTSFTGEALYTTHSSNSTVTALTGYFGEKCKVENTIVDGCTIDGKGCITAGLTAVGSRLDAKNITVKNTTITESGVNNGPNSTRSMGGLAGYIGTLNAEEIIVENVDIKGKVRTVGGVVAAVSTVEKLERITVNDLTIDNKADAGSQYGSIGGVIGDLMGGNPTVNNCVVKNSKFTSDTNNIGGLFGSVSSEITITDCTVDNLEADNKNSCASQNTGNVGGLVGCVSENLKIQNSNVNNSNLKISGDTVQNEHIGGLVGFANDINISNTDVKATDISNNTNGNTGGLIGMTYYYNNINTGKSYASTATVSDVNVENCKSITGKGHLGGIIGFGKVVCQVPEGATSVGSITGTKINGTSSAYDVGGVIGNGLLGTDINNINITGCDISASSRVGGVAGYNVGNISNVTVSDTDVYTTGETHAVGGIIGTAAESSSEITNSIVTNSTVSGVNGYVGGIAGFANNTITGTDVINSTITATGNNAVGLGGIIGHGSNILATKTYIEDCEVNGCTLSGNDSVGGIAGVAVAEIVDCKVVGVVSEVASTLANTVVVEDEVVVDNVDVEGNIEDKEEENSNENTLSNVESVYSTIVTGNKNVGGIIGFGGELIENVSDFVTISNCSIKGIQIVGNENVQEAIGKNSFYATDDITIYDVITNFLKENFDIKVGE